MFAKSNTIIIINNILLLFRALSISVFLMYLLDFVCLCMGRKNKVITKIGVQSRCLLVTDTWFCHSHWLWRLFVHGDLELDLGDIFSIVLRFIFSNSLFYHYLNQCFNSWRRNWIVFWCSSATCQFREKQKMPFVLHVSFAKKKYLLVLLITLQEPFIRS